MPDTPLQGEVFDAPLETVSARERANAIRFLSVDAISAAASGHPGAPLGLADIAEVLWHQTMRYCPDVPDWPNRDRFVLSNGHAAMLLYSVLHLTGYPMTIADLQAFRQWGSRTPGHPERDIPYGVETTTGPLGQGFANAVGMALAEKLTASRYNRPGFSVCDHWTYVIVGDGCLMEGVSHEAASLAGTWQLSKLVVLMDDNGISIDGPVQGWCRDDVAQRFLAYGFHVIQDVDGHDSVSIARALACARSDQSGKPHLLICKTRIGYGVPGKEGTAAVHGAPLTPQETQDLRHQLHWPHAPFAVPASIYQSWNAQSQGRIWYEAWKQNWEAYTQAYPDLAAELEQRWSGHVPEAATIALEQLIEKWRENGPSIASRQASLQVLNCVAPLIPQLIGGSADLSGSNGTQWKAAPVYDPATRIADARYLQYGVREFGMTAIMNGLAAYGGFLPYGGTFLTFADYARNALRLSALMHLPVVAVYTHDSIGLGEDGPTHQPIEHLAMLRMTPHLDVWRPMDATETAVAWQCILHNRNKPAALVLSRQTLPAFMVHSKQACADMQYGAYILWESPCTLPESSERGSFPDVIVLASGSEVHLAWQAAVSWAQQHPEVVVRVVSMPCAEAFEAAPAAYQESVLPGRVSARVAVEAASTAYWYRWVGLAGHVVGLDRFGASAPAEVLYTQLGLTVSSIQSALSHVYTAQQGHAIDSHTPSQPHV